MSEKNDDKKPEDEKTNIIFTIDAEMAKRLDEIAEADKGIRRPSRNHVARKIVEDYLAKRR